MPPTTRLRWTGPARLTGTTPPSQMRFSIRCSRRAAKFGPCGRFCCKRKWACPAQDWTPSATGSIQSWTAAGMRMHAPKDTRPPCPFLPDIPQNGRPDAPRRPAECQNERGGPSRSRPFVFQASGKDQPSVTVAFTILPGSRGGSPLGSASTFSMPSTTWPQTVYCLSRKRASSKQMKNWLLAECG